VWPQWITAVATAIGAFLVVAHLRRAVRHAQQRGLTQRRENTITTYLETLDSRSKIKGDELPDDRDAEAIREFIETLLEAERDGRERESEIARNRRALTQYLSFWEAVALGVRQEVFDADTLRMQAASHSDCPLPELRTVGSSARGEVRLTALREPQGARGALRAIQAR
jgi:hypothetical protein